MYCQSEHVLSLETWDLESKGMVTINVAKTKMPISCAVTHS